MRVCHQVIVSVQADPVVPLTALPTVHMHGHARPSGLARFSPLTLVVNIAGSLCRPVDDLRWCVALGQIAELGHGIAHLRRVDCTVRSLSFTLRFSDVDPLPFGVLLEYHGDWSCIVVEAIRVKGVSHARANERVRSSDVYNAPFRLSQLEDFCAATVALHSNFHVPPRS